MAGNDFVEVSAIYISQTDHWITIQKFNGEEVYLPRTTVENGQAAIPATKFETIKLQVQEWIAKKHGLIAVEETTQ